LNISGTTLGGYHEQGQCDRDRPGANSDGDESRQESNE
jgi:hypothetical protein